MVFSKLAEYFEKLEDTSSRLALIDILSQLFNEVKEDEIAKVSYLIQGRVAPFYEATEIGMAEKSVAAAIARAYGVERDDVLKSYGKLGDLGKVALILGERIHKKHQEPSVDEVFKCLTEIAKTSGEGTVEKRLTLLTDLLKKVSPVSAKHLVRIPLGVSRLGIGDPTVLDAFAQSKLGDRSPVRTSVGDIIPRASGTLPSASAERRKNRKLLEGAYNKTSDLGIIGETLWKGGLKAVEKLDVTVGRPIRSQLAERLPDPKTILQKYEGKAHVQYKYDGFRVQIHLDRSLPEGKQVRFFSRNLEETTPMFPDLIAGVLDQVKAKTAILDSEALAYNPESEEFLPFQQTSQRRRKHGIEQMAKTMPLKAFVFDVMYADGKSLIDQPLESRIKTLEKIVQGDQVLTSGGSQRQGSQGTNYNKSERSAAGVLIPQPGEITDKPDRIKTLFEDALSKGLEGLIVKRPDSPYEAGARNFNWVKLKRHSSGELKDTIDTVILGYIYGRGKRAEFGAGALLVGVYDIGKDEFVTVSKIGTGLSDDEWREIHKRADKIKVDKEPARVNSILEPSVWIKPEIVIEVLADEITRSPNHTAGKDEDGIGYALRFPRLVRFRDADKRPEDATTVKELKEMYKLQYKKS